MDERYRIIKKIGEGGTSNTYLVMDTKLNKEWVMKKIITNRTEQKESLRREIDALLRINRPGIPSLADIIHNPDDVCLIMEYMKGESVEEIITKNGPMPEKEVRKCAVEIAELVDFLHGLNPPLIHGDLKPSNIIKGERISLLDFGSSVCYGSKLDEGSGFYTPGYASLELIAGDIADISSDIYALGAIMFYMITGEDPAALRGVYPVREWDPVISKKMEEIICRCTDKNPEKRFCSMKEVIEKLKESWRCSGGKEASRLLFRPIRSLLLTE